MGEGARLLLVLVVFANDSIADEREVAMLKRLALEDGVVDDAEKEVLRNVIARVADARLTDGPTPGDRRLPQGVGRLIREAVSRPS